MRPMSTLIDLRTPNSQKLIGRLDPISLRLHVRVRGEDCVFDVLRLAQAARGRGGDGPILVRSEE